MPSAHRHPRAPAAQSGARAEHPPPALAADALDRLVKPASADLVGVPLALTDYDSAMNWIDATVAHREKGYVCVAAVHTVMACREDPELQAAVLGSSMTVPDGQPLVWALNALGHRLRSRVYGPELM